MTDLNPREIVSELDRHIIGQDKAKRAVAIALRNRWRRIRLEEPIRSEVMPKNILMIGPTGCGKTEIARRLARLANAPFIKVEATKFTEVGYVGRDVEQIIRDLMEASLHLARAQAREDVATRASHAADQRVLAVIVGESAGQETRNRFRAMMLRGDLDDKEIEIEIEENASLSMPTVDIPGMQGAQMGMLNLGDIFGKAFGGKKKRKTLTVAEARRLLEREEADQLVDEDRLVREALDNVEQNGIVFLDEIDKICGTSDSQRGKADVSREGVQRDLLPLIEGTTVSTRYGPIKTDHVLFVASGAFHQSKPSDLLPELQGRLPIRVELTPLTQEDFLRILEVPEAGLTIQSQALMSTEGLTLSFTGEALAAIARLAAEINESIENIGARRLHTVMEQLLEDLSFNAPEMNGQSIVVDEAMVIDRLSALAKDQDLSRYIL